MFVDKEQLGETGTVEYSRIFKPIEKTVRVDNPRHNLTTLWVKGSNIRDVDRQDMKGTTQYVP